MATHVWLCRRLLLNSSILGVSVAIHSLSSTHLGRVIVAIVEMQMTTLKPVELTSNVCTSAVSTINYCDGPAEALPIRLRMPFSG